MSSAEDGIHQQEQQKEEPVSSSSSAAAAAEAAVSVSPNEQQQNESKVEAEESKGEEEGDDVVVAAVLVTDNNNSVDVDVAAAPVPPSPSPSSPSSLSSPSSNNIAPAESAVTKPIVNGEGDCVSRNDIDEKHTPDETFVSETTNDSHTGSNGTAIYNHENTSTREDKVSTSSKTQENTVHSPHRRRRVSRLIFILSSLLRILLIDAPLSLLFASYLTIYSIQQIYDTYYIPIIYRTRRTDLQLLQEYTYYNRQCTSLDISTTKLQDIIIPTTIQEEEEEEDKEVEKKEKVVAKAVRTMIQHGAIVLPKLLSYNTTQSLRQYIVTKNANIHEDEKYPVSQGYRRLSYGIDAAEHPIVSTAIQEIVSSPILLPILQSILGDVDPASAEITVITNYYQAPPQVWHQDTKQDGNAIKYARTYTHSYSLFIPLQDIQESMGPTDICIGTQYCTNDLETMCEENKIGLHLIGNAVTSNRYSSNNSTNDDETDDISSTKGSVFPAGYGALLNQHVWHRGGAHVDPNALERIVFIMSFLSRPKHHQTTTTSAAALTTSAITPDRTNQQQQQSTNKMYYNDDQRQLSRGTYFHQKWNMWGHTIADLQHPMKYMKYPYSILRCLYLYNVHPNKNNWGYDLITATIMRFANEQLENEDLSGRFIPKLQQFYIPSFLYGRVLSDDDDNNNEQVTQIRMWTTFIEGTIHNMCHYIQMITMYLHGIYFLLILLLALVMAVWHRSIFNSTSVHIIRSSVQRIVITHTVIFCLCVYVWYIIQSSSWSNNILSGRTLQRPFPVELLPKSQQQIVGLSYLVNSNDGEADVFTTATAATGAKGSRIQSTLPTSSIISKTTIPTRYDVLFGTRYDASFLGSYNQWLDYHPGNKLYNKIIQRYRIKYQYMVASTFPMYTTSILIQQIIHDMYQKSNGQNRYLQQNWLTGDWHIIYDNDTTDEHKNRAQLEQIILDDLYMKQNHPIRIQLNYQIAYQRFGPFRNTTLAIMTQLHLIELRKQILTVSDIERYLPAKVKRTDTKVSTSDNTVCCRIPRKQLLLRQPHQQQQSVGSNRFGHERKALPMSVPASSSFSSLVAKSDDILSVGTLVWYNYEESDDWVPGVVMYAYPNEEHSSGLEYSYDINVDDGVWYNNVSRSQLHLYQSVVSGDPVYGCFDVQLNDCYSGVVLHVYASGNIKILYDDGDIYDQVPPNMYYIPPYKYDGPYQN